MNKMKLMSAVCSLKKLHDSSDQNCSIFTPVGFMKYFLIKQSNRFCQRSMKWNNIEDSIRSPTILEQNYTPHTSEHSSMILY